MIKVTSEKDARKGKLLIHVQIGDYICAEEFNEKEIRDRKQKLITDTLYRALEPVVNDIEQQLEGVFNGTHSK